MLRTYKTQSKLKKAVKEMLKDIGVCDSIKKFHSEKWEEFMYLFERHPDYPEKFNGLTDIKIMYNPINKQLDPRIIKSNGDEDDVSLLNKCISGKPSNDLSKAMRNEIYPQIQEFRKNYIKENHIMKCELCLCTSLDNKNFDIDHYEPQFVDLQKAFLNNWKELVPNTFEAGKRRSKIFTNKDNDFEQEWSEFHRTNATLRVLCKECNASREKVGVQRCNRFK